MKTTKIYLNYAIKDQARVLEIYKRLESAGFHPWMASENILPGQDWNRELDKALKEADFFLSILSKNTEKGVGFYGEEIINYAFKLQKEKPDGTIFLIPVKLEDCSLPAKLQSIQSLDLFHANGWDRLLKTLTHATTPDFDRPVPPEALVEACQSGRCVLYAGAGLSAPAGFPTWQSFVRGLLEWAITKELIDTRFGESLKSSIDSGEIDSVADSIFAAVQEKLDIKVFTKYLHEIFGYELDKPTEAHRVLHQIDFSAVLTTNFDTLLEQNYPDVPVYTPHDIEALRELQAKEKRFILKLYGIVERPETVLISSSQYEDAIVGNRDFSRFMESMFVSKTILFIGSSLEGILDYLEGITLRESSRMHYALVAVSGTAWETKAEQLRRRYNIQVIPYPVSENHPEVLEFLKELAQQAPAQIGNENLGLNSSKGREPVRLKKIRLENIGPFEELELLLESDWNILLGNNGVGKSTILKAIAIAICGSSAQQYASRLIKAKGQKGTIILETTRDEKYITELHRTTSGVEIKSIPGVPLEIENWLALGFSPIRVVSWNQSKGPQLDKKRERPIAEDLLPLLTGDPDSRMDGLKQWIVNLDYRMEKERANQDSQGNFYTELRDELFRVFAQITGDLKIEFKGVDPKTYQIKVTTDDGELPIEAVSQGTAALIGWVGVLVQRLYAIFEENPLQQYAIVLLDEMDAHMHPKWQQSLIRDLKELFPKVQFIVTTHSPLVVSGMPTQNVIRLVRDSERKVVPLKIPEDRTRGRTDQILTGELFGLRTTLDLTTQNESERYYELLHNSERTEDEEEEFKALRNYLQSHIPVPQETPEERRAQELLRILLKQQIGDDYPEVQDKLMEKAEELLKAVQTRKEKR